MFHSIPLQKKSMARRLSPPGLKLADEEHDQERDELQHLLIAQRQLDCQFQHGISPVYAGSAANWLRVGYLLHAVAWRGSRLTANSLEQQLGFCTTDLTSERRHLAVALIASGVLGRTLSRVVARQLGLLAQVRYPARDSARVMILKHNV